jgi:hypothetical protein
LNRRHERPERRSYSPALERHLPARADFFEIPRSKWLVFVVRIVLAHLLVVPPHHILRRRHRGELGELPWDHNERHGDG